MPKRKLSKEVISKLRQPIPPEEQGPGDAVLRNPLPIEHIKLDLEDSSEDRGPIEKISGKVKKYSFSSPDATTAEILKNLLNLGSSIALGTFGAGVGKFPEGNPPLSQESLKKLREITVAGSERPEILKEVAKRSEEVVTKSRNKFKEIKEPIKIDDENLLDLNKDPKSFAEYKVWRDALKESKEKPSSWIQKEDIKVIEPKLPSKQDQLDFDFESLRSNKPGMSGRSLNIFKGKGTLEEQPKIKLSEEQLKPIKPQEMTDILASVTDHMDSRDALLLKLAKVKDGNEFIRLKTEIKGFERDINNERYILRERIGREKADEILKAVPIFHAEDIE